MSKCTVCRRLYLHERNLIRHIQSHHNQQSFTCGQCGKSFTRSGNLTKHRRVCNGHRVQPQQQQQRPTTATTAPEFTVRHHRTTMGGAVERHEIDMQGTHHLDHLSNAIHLLQRTMQNFQHKHQAYKFQIAITIVCHKAVDSSVVTQPTVTLTSEMCDVYADAAPPLHNANRELLNFIEVFERNGSGWVFSHFESLQLTLWQFNPLRGSTHVPLPRWIQTKRSVVNITCAGDDCFKWGVLAGMNPVDVHADRMGKYVEHRGKCDFPPLHFPVLLSSVDPFASANEYGVDDDKVVIYPLRVSSTLVPERRVDLLLFERDGVHDYTTIGNFSRQQGVAAGSGELSSRVFQEDVPCSFSYKIVSSSVSDFSKALVSYRGEDAAEMFVLKLQEEAKQLLDEYIATPKSLLPLTVAELGSFHTATNCHICNQLLESDKVRDHCHVVGN